MKAGTLTLSRTAPGVISTFDARDYSFIDFLPIEYQWTALVQVGFTLRIVFKDGSVIELLNFYANSLTGDAANGGDHTGTLADALGDFLVRISATQLMSSKEFARTHGVTKTSGYVAVPAFEGHDGDQAAGGLTAQNAPDVVRLTFPPPPSAPGVEFPPPPMPPPLLLPPPVTLPPSNTTVITGATAGVTIEAGGTANATPGVPVVSGDLDATNVDGPADGWNAVGAPTPSTHGYGTFVMTAAGVWTYTLNNANAAVDGLAVGGTLNDAFTVTAVDGTSQVVSITITGVNDAPLVTGAVDSGEVTEGPLPVMTTTGTIDFGDVDLIDAHVTSVTPGGSGYLGALVADVTNASSGDGSGHVRWVFLANNQLRQALQDGQQLMQTYIVEIDDGHGGTVSQLVTITITGTNDAAVITGDTAGSVIEAGGVANVIPGVPVVSGDLDAADVDDPDDVWEAVGSPAASVSGYGSYTMTATGAWTYTLDNNNTTVQALNADVSLIDSFMALTTDGTSQLVTITITGANDAAEITGDVSGAVTEDGVQTASGNLDVADEDSGENQLQPIAAGTAGSNGYGTFEVLADGAWTYTLDNADPAVQALPAGQTLQDTITVTSADGTDTQLITITITGANGPAVITGDVSGAVTEDGVQTASGNLDVADEDSGENQLQPIAAGTAGSNGYGTFEVLADGAWTYTLDNADPAVQALPAGQTLQDTITVTSAGRHRHATDHHHHHRRQRAGGHHRRRVGCGDRGRRPDRVRQSRCGRRGQRREPAAADRDRHRRQQRLRHLRGVGRRRLDLHARQCRSRRAGAAGRADAAGHHHGDLGRTAPTRKLITITITGANGLAVITGDVSGAVTEDGVQTASGNLDVADEDSGENQLQPIVTGTAGSNGYGTFEVLADGAWTYTLDNTDPAVQALPAGQTLQDTITVTSAGRYRHAS